MNSGCRAAACPVTHSNRSTKNALRAGIDKRRRLAFRSKHLARRARCPLVEQSRCRLALGRVDDRIEVIEKFLQEVLPHFSEHVAGAGSLSYLTNGLYALAGVGLHVIVGNVWAAIRLGAVQVVFRVSRDWAGAGPGRSVGIV